MPFSGPLQAAYVATAKEQGRGMGLGRPIGHLTSRR